MKPKWLIYARVSSLKQVQEWNWLSSQEKRCWDYAKNTLWIEIERVFYDEWVSWWLFERKSIRELLKYIQDNKKSEYVVIFEDLNRLSRDIQVHHLIKKEIQKRWASLACVNFKFEDSPEWNFKENISVVVSSYEREKNKQRVCDRMKTRLEEWFWCFPVPVWYTYTKSSKWWKKVLLDESNHKIIKSALEKYASGELYSINDVSRFLFKKGIKTWNIKNWKVYNSNLVARMLKNILYAGYLELPKWDIKRTKANHKEIISLKTYDRIQERLYEKKTDIEAAIESSINRVDLSEDFPLRGFLYCEESKQMISWAWSQWKNKKFPYYVFPRKSPLHWKSINRDKFHEHFESLLKDIQPKEDLIQTFEKAVEFVLERRKKNSWKQKISLTKSLKKIHSKIDNFIERIWATNSEILIANYEKKIEELELEKNKISTKISSDLKSVRTPFKSEMKLAKNALYIWKNSNIENKKKVLKNIFPEWIPINKKKQVWTPTFSLIYQSFSIWESSFSSMVDLPGFEPRTLSLRGICSTNWAKSPDYTHHQKYH